MDFYAHICKNGDVLIEHTPLSGLTYCEKCGAEVLACCPSCQSPIKEWHYSMATLGKPSYERPAYCQKCGKPYPWTAAAIEATTELIEEETELDELQREKLISSLPDIVSETPKTSVAVVRVKKALLAAGKFTSEGIRQFAIDFGCELAKKQLGL